MRGMLVNLRRTLPIVGLLAGAALLATVVACGGGDNDDSTPTTASSVAPSSSSTATSEPPSPTSTPTEVPTPTATPTPYDGAVARFRFPRLGIDAPVDALGVNAKLELDTPHGGRENTAVGWYDQNADTKGLFVGTRPGWGGNAFFSAHVYYINRSACPNNPLSCPAPFQKLMQAVEGDDVYVSMANGTEYHYKVLYKKRYTRDNVPMGDLISPPEKPEGKEWITMMTCGGSLDASGVEYVSRDVVVAERVS